MAGVEILAVDIREEIILFLPRLRRFAYSLTGNRTDTDDLVQDVCLRALDRAFQWQPGTRIDSWLYRIAHNLWIDRVRSEKTRNAARQNMLIQTEEATTAHNPAEDRLALRAVEKAMAELTDEQKVAISLVCIDGLTYREAADIMGVPIGTVMSRLSRARKELHRKMHGETDA